MSCGERSIIVAKSTHSTNARLNNNRSYASGASLAGDLIPSVKEDNHPCFPSNNAITPCPLFPFEVAPTQELNTDSIMGETFGRIPARHSSVQDLAFPFDLAPCPQRNVKINDEGSQNIQAGNPFTNHPDFSSPTDFCQKSAGFAGDINIGNDFGGRETSFPFDITPSQQHNIDIISGQSSFVPGKSHVLHAGNDEATRLRGSRGGMVHTVSLISGTFS